MSYFGFAYHLGPLVSGDGYIDYHFDMYEGKQVLNITVKKLPSGNYAYLDEEIYIRNSAETVKLSTREFDVWRATRNLVD